ncbi:hypothetical protein [Nocardioides pakistanensis]
MRIPTLSLRRRNDDGMVAVPAMAIMLLLAATSLSIFSAAAISTEQSRTGRDFTQARENLDQAIADVMWNLNEGTLGDRIADVTTSDTSTGKGERGYWRWSVSDVHRDTERGVVGWDVTLTSCVDGDQSRAAHAGTSIATGYARCVSSDSGLTQTRTVPVGYTYVQFVDDGTKPGGYRYGVDPYGAWQYALSVTGDSWLASNSLTDVVAAFGPAKVDDRTGDGFDTLVSYDDRAKATGGDAEQHRVSLNATFDAKTFAAKKAQCAGRWQGEFNNSVPVNPPTTPGTDTSSYRRGASRFVGHVPDVRGNTIRVDTVDAVERRGLACFDSIKVVDLARLSGSGNIAEVVVKGDVEIGQGYRLDPGMRRQMHLYVGGDMRFYAAKDTWRWEYDYRTRTRVPEYNYEPGKKGEPPVRVPPYSRWTSWSGHTSPVQTVSGASASPASRFNGFVFAPDGACATMSGAGVLPVTGALACERAGTSASNGLRADITYQSPLLSGAGPTPIYYTQSQGFTALTHP